jgi:hypothetical protein
MNVWPMLRECLISFWHFAVDIDQKVSPKKKLERIEARTKAREARERIDRERSHRLVREVAAIEAAAKTANSVFVAMPPPLHSLNVAQTPTNPSVEALAPPTRSAELGLLITTKKRWDRIDAELQGLRDARRVLPGIRMETKAHLILDVEAGSSLLGAIKVRAPQFIPQSAAPTKSGCLVLLMAIPVAIAVGSALLRG